MNCCAETEILAFTLQRVQKAWKRIDFSVKFRPFNGSDIFRVGTTERLSRNPRDHYDPVVWPVAVTLTEAVVRLSSAHDGWSTKSRGLHRAGAAILHCTYQSRQRRRLPAAHQVALQPRLQDHTLRTGYKPFSHSRPFCTLGTLVHFCLLTRFMA